MSALQATETWAACKQQHCAVSSMPPQSLSPSPTRERSTQKVSVLHAAVTGAASERKHSQVSWVHLASPSPSPTREWSIQRVFVLHAAEIYAASKRQHSAVPSEPPASSSLSPSPAPHQHCPTHTPGRHLPFARAPSCLFKSEFFHILTRGPVSPRFNIRRPFRRKYGEPRFSEREPRST